MGCESRSDLRRVEKLLAEFEISWPEAAEFAEAFSLVRKHRLSSGLDIPDCLIAAMCLARNARLYTFNLKHFRAIAGLDAQSPYAR